MDGFDFVLLFILFWFFGWFSSIFVFVLIDDGPEQIEELGGSICEETYGVGSEFVSYRDSILKCSDPVSVMVYDGLLVKKVGNG